VDSESLEKMVSQAKNEINQIERQLVTLTARRNLLWRFVSSSRDLIEDEVGEPVSRALVSAKDIAQSSPALNTLIAPNAASVSLPTNRVWEAVQLVMRVAKRPLTVPEIIELLERHKIIIGGGHPRENVRSAINRREDVFEKIDRGFYVLVEWPDNIKQLRKDEPISIDAA